MTSSFAVEEVFAPSLDNGDDDLAHVFCECNEDISLCGRDISEAEHVEGWESGILECVVCIDLEKTTSCPNCDKVLPP